MSRKSVVSISLGLVGLACATGALDRHTPPSATLSVESGIAGESTVKGIVVDGDGDAIADAILVMECECLGAEREMRSNDAGVFRLDELPAGFYTLTAMHEKHSISKEFTMGRGQTIRVNFSLGRDERSPLIIT